MIVEALEGREESRRHGGRPRNDPQSALAVCETRAEQGIAGIRLHKGDREGIPRSWSRSTADNDRVERCCSRQRTRCSAARHGFGRGSSFATAATCCSSTKLAKCRLRTCSPVPAARRVSCCSGIHSSSSSRSKRAIRPARQASALEHILGGDKTIAEDRGLFLHQTRRLHPAICEFTAELFYDGRLSSFPGLELQACSRGSGARGRRPGSCTSRSSTMAGSRARTEESRTIVGDGRDLVRELDVARPARRRTPLAPRKFSSSRRTTPR